MDILGANPLRSGGIAEVLGKQYFYVRPYITMRYIAD